jgi:L-fuconolactonase
MLIDAHHHLWRYSQSEYGWIDDTMSVLRRDFLADQLAEVARTAEVDGFVSVQARQSIAETESLLALAQQQPQILGVVAWLPLAAEELSLHLDRLSGSPWLKAVRHVVQDEPDDRFLLGEAFNRGVATLARYGLVYDILIYARQLPAAIAFVDAHPQQVMVLDHIAKPTITASQFDTPWEQSFRELAKREHVRCKFSGVATEIRTQDGSGLSSGRPTDWSVDQIRRYWDVALEAFTPKRLMFGSDWPVCLLATSYDRWLATVRELAAELSPGEQADLFADTAIATYQLQT